jgi:hypothetical protein
VKKKKKRSCLENLKTKNSLKDKEGSSTNTNRNKKVNPFESCDLNNADKHVGTKHEREMK